MKLLNYLISKKTTYLTNIALGVAGFICLSQGVNEQTKVLAYFSSFFFYFLVRRLNIWENIIVGLAIGGSLGYTLYSWLSLFADFTALNLSVAFNAVVFAVVFASAHSLYKKFPDSLFINVFALSTGVFAIRTIFHYSPVFAYVKAFLMVVNTSTVFDWLVPYFGSTITDVLVLATGSLIALIYIQVRNKKISQSLYIYVACFILILTVPIIKLLHPSRSLPQTESVKVALVQGSFNWSWEERLKQTDHIIKYYIAETKYAARKGAEIVVWPEYAVPMDILHDRREISEQLANLSSKENVVLVTGSLELITDQLNPNGKWIGYDLSLVFDPEKILLEPYRAVYPISNNVKVGNKPIIFDTKYGSFPVISCFEVAYHKFVADYSNQNHPLDFFIGIANIQLFQGTEGGKRIKDHIRRIAMENGKYFIYVSNTGPSFVLNPAGEFEHLIPNLKKETLIVNIRKIKERTFYSRYQDLPLFMFFVVGYWATYSRLKKKKRKKSKERN